MHRKYQRAFSECPPPEAGLVGNRDRSASFLSIIRTQSDSDLLKIDRKKTFAQINTAEPNDLLAKVASALGQLRPEDNDAMDGVQGFSDSQILASERTWGGWSNGREDKGPYRIRAASETKLPHRNQSDDAYEWTWSGANDQINDLRKLREKSKHNDLYRASFSGAAGRRRQSSTVVHIPPSQETTITSGQNRFMGRFNNIFRKRAMSTTSSLMQQLPSNIHEDAIKYLKATSNDYPQNSGSRYLNTYNGAASRPPAPGYSRRGSIFESLQSQNSQILENTTIADLIKVLEAVHTQAALGDEQPKRKLGTASLTPPEMPSIFGLFDPTPDIRETYEKYNPSRRGSMFPSLNIPSSSRRGSLMPTGSKLQPPPYSSLEVPSAAASNAKRRFSVRPTAPQHAPSISSLASTSSASQVPPITRKLSLRPSPLAREPSLRDSGRFAKPISLQREVISRQNARQRHGSLTNLPERPAEKKRYDSK